MILSVQIDEKSFNNKRLMKDVKFSINEGEKVGIIGRNGIGKSTLFGILLGRDKDFSGDIIYRKNTVLSSTQQEYSDVSEKTVLQFVLNDLPEYTKLNKLITELPLTMGDNIQLIDEYSEALERFHQKNFHFIEDKIIEDLKNFSLNGFENKKMKELSGGQKRLVDTIKIIHSQSDIALVDEPTNFMDFAAKKSFLDWMKNSKEAVLVITHDRDVLKQVDKIIEIRDGESFEFRGNYDDYLKQNAFSTTNKMQDYEGVQRRIANLKIKTKEYQRMKEKARDPGTIQRFKRLENNARDKLTKLSEIDKPTFWIDKQNVADLNFKAAKSYDKFKAKNVKIDMGDASEKSRRDLVVVEDLALGYGDLEDAIECKNGAKILFEGLSFKLNVGGVIEFHGRNGAGKSSLIKSILNKQNSALPNVYSGNIFVDNTINIGEYTQEITSEFFELPLKNAIEKVYLDQNLEISETKLRSILSQYLFTEADFALPIGRLSGGQKARFQIIKMLSNNPQLIILDEPTSHLDLPSIEELEDALKRYNGAVIFVSHDEYFRENMRKNNNDFKTVEIGVN